MGTILKILVAVAIAAALLWVSGTLSGKVVNKIGDTAYAVSYNPKLKHTRSWRGGRRRARSPHGSDFVPRVGDKAAFMPCRL